MDKNTWRQYKMKMNDTNEKEMEIISRRNRMPIKKQTKINSNFIGLK